MGWRQAFKDIFSKYKAIVMIGNCLGGTAALLFADLADRVIVFGPQTSLLKARGMYYLNSLRIPSSLVQSFEGNIEERAKACGSVFVYFSPVKDTYMADFIEVSRSLHVEIIKECDRASVAQWMKREGTLASFLQKHVDDTLTNITKQRDLRRQRTTLEE